MLSYAQEILGMSFFLKTLPCWNKTVLVICLGLLDEWQPWAVDKELSCMCNCSLYRVSQMYILTEKVKKTQEECPASGPQSFNPLKWIQYHICLGGWKTILKQGIFSYLEVESSNLFPSMAITQPFKSMFISGSACPVWTFYPGSWREKTQLILTRDL